MKNQKFNHSKKKIDQFVRYSSLAFEMMIIMVLGVFAGHQIDQWLRLSFPVCTLIFMILSVIGAVFYAIRKFLK